MAVGLQPWAEFVEAMEAQLRVLNDLLDIEQKKTEVLLEGKAADLEVLIKGEQVLIWQLARQEERRYSLQESLAPSLSHRPADLTVGRLVELAPVELKEKLEYLAEQYQAVCASLTARNEQNSDLIRGALSYFEFALHVLGGQPETSAVYKAAREPVSVRKDARFLDNRA